MLDKTADEVYSIVTDNLHDSEFKCEVVSDLKAHIKRDFVDLSEVPRYFEALKAANKSQDYKLVALSFSATCHLIKRVGMQDPNILRAPSKIVLPILLGKLLDQKTNLQAKSALETYWLATPTIVEAYFRDNALIHSNVNIRAQSIIFLSELIELNKNFNFSSFLPNLVNLLRDDSIEVVKNVEVLFLKYYTLHKSKTPDLVKEFRSQGIASKRAVNLLKEIDTVIANSYAAEIATNAQQAKPTIDTFNNLAKPVKRGAVASTVHRSAQTSRIPSTGSTTGVGGASKDLSEILADVPTAQLDGALKPIVVNSTSELNREVESLLPPFVGRETEFNWGKREASIIRFRGIVAGNYERYPNELVQATRSMLDGINKSVLSLRTTLSSNGCQLIKELAAHLAKHLDPIAENLFQPLATLTSATKKIASLNAFGSLCMLLDKTSFNNRLFNQCCYLYQDKNIQPRLYSSTFLQIFILKHGARLDNMNFESITRWVSKGVSDPNTTVRESMRMTFWILFRKFPDVADPIYNKQDTSVKKALDRAKPKGVEGPAGSVAPASKPGLPQFDRKRPQVRDFIAAAKRDRRSTSGPHATVPSTTQENTDPNDVSTASVNLGPPARVGVAAPPLRAAPSKESQPLRRQVSKGSKQEMEKQKFGMPSRDNTIEVVKMTTHSPVAVEPMESGFDHLKRCLASPLTRERVEGVELLKELLHSDKKLPDLTSILSKLVILDTPLLKPLLSIPKFFELLDITAAIKALAVNKEGIDVLLDKFGNAALAKGFVKLVNSLDMMTFENAPSTMFHVKHKSLFLDYSIQNLYSITSGGSHGLDDTLLGEISRAVFPLCISDYPRYDELIVQLHVLNQSVFEDVLLQGSGYVKAKIHSILDEFKDDIEEKILENTIPIELTRINPFNHATVVVEAPQHGTETDEQDQSKKDLMGGIFAMADSRTGNDLTFVGPRKTVPSTEPTEEVEDDDDMDMDDSSPEPEALTENAEGRVPSPDLRPRSEASPFLDNPNEDDIIPPPPQSDEATRTLTSQISNIHISPQKERFTPTDRKSLSDIITKADPIFNKTRKHIKIFEDAPPVVPMEKKLTDYELNRIHQMNDEEATIAQILEHVNKFNNDKVEAKDMNTIIKILQQSIDKEEINAWMKDGGFKTVLGSVTNYFNSSVNITRDLCYKGLIVLKEMLIIDEFLEKVISLSELVAIWNILTMVVENLKDFRNALFVSVGELTDDLIKTDVPESKKEILKSCILNLKEAETTVTLSFLLSSLSKCIEHDNLSLDQIKEIDRAVFKYMTHSEAEVRRLTIITYSKCKRKLQEINSNSQTAVDEKLHSTAERAYNEVFAKLTDPQRRMVDFFCNN